MKEHHYSVGASLEKPASSVALVLIDVINDFSFEEGGKLLEMAVPMAKNLAVLKARAKREGIPIIYVNDNFGRWRSDFRHLVEHCLSPTSRGAEVALLLHPDPEDYFVLKPRHSGFFGSCLEVLLQSLEVTTLVLSGVAGNICVLYTANDGYMRGYRIVVASDCTASNSRVLNDQALSQMGMQLKALVLHAEDIDFAMLRREHGCRLSETTIIL